MKKIIIIIIVLAVIAIGFYVNETQPNEAGYETTSLITLNK